MPENQFTRADMKFVIGVGALIVVLGSVLAVTTDNNTPTADAPSPSASATPAPCDNSLCYAYDAGFEQGRKMLRDGTPVRLTAAERASLPRNDGTMYGAVAQDHAVAVIGCRKEMPYGHYTDAEAPAWLEGCADGAGYLSQTAGGEGRWRYQKPAP